MSSANGSIKVAQASLEKKSEPDREKVTQLKDKLEAGQSSTGEDSASDKEDTKRPEKSDIQPDKPADPK